MSHELVKDTLKWIQENHSPSDTFLTSEENARFFSIEKPKPPSPQTVYTAPIQKAKLFKEERKIEPPLAIKKQPPAALPIEELLRQNGGDSPTVKEQKVPFRNQIYSSANSPLKGRDCARAAVQTIIEKVHPHFTLTAAIPDDAMAKKKAESWKENSPPAQVAILYFSESPHDLEFLKKIAKAVHSSFAPTKLIDAKRISDEKRWDAFLKEGNYKLIISPEKGVQSSFELMRLYTEIPKTQARFLGKTALLLLSSLDQYEKNPHLKRTLWTTLCQILKT